jgi:hypothetical protein
MQNRIILPDEIATKINNKGFKQYQNYFGRNKRRHCMVAHCDKDAIRSHAISKNSYLRLISENNEVMTVKSQRSGMKWNMEFIPESINDATTFGGFCNEHDRYFERLDNGLFETLHDLINQCYRSMAHTMYNYEFLFHLQEHEYDDFEEFISTNESRYKELGITKEKFKLVCIEENKKLWDKRLEEYERVSIFKEELYDLLEINKELKNSELINGSSFGYGYINSNITYRRIPFIVPATIVNRIMVAVDAKPTDLHFTLIPDKNCTHFIQFNYQNSKFFVNDFLNKTKDNISTLNHIERIMLLNEKNWYVDPKVVNKIPVERRKMIEQDMYFITERGFNDIYDISIFDDIRQDIINELKPKDKDRELKKIYELPFRRKIEDREKDSDLGFEMIWLCK